MIRSRRAFAVTIAGFSLVELLVALVLLSMVFLVLFNSLGLGLKIWNASEQELSGNTQALAARGFLRRVLSEARPVMTTLGAPNAQHRVFFLGTQDSIRFVAPMPSHLAVGGFYEIAIYAIEGGQTGNRLEMYWSLFRRENWPSKPLTEERRIELIAKVAEVEL
jgi:general secretion pathway protein J